MYVPKRFSDEIVELLREHQSRPALTVEECQRIMDLCRYFPILTTIQFYGLGDLLPRMSESPSFECPPWGPDCRPAPWRTHYILHAVIVRAPLLFTMDFCETFYPDEASSPQSEEFHPLHVACRWGNSVPKGLIPYLAAKYPKEASRKWSNKDSCEKFHRLPLDYLIRSGSSCITNYKALYNAYPSTITSDSIATALTTSYYEHSLSEFLIRNAAPETVPSIWLTSYFAKGGQYSDHGTRPLSDIFNLLSANLQFTLTELRIEKEFEWDHDAWKSLADLLSCDAIQELILHIECPNDGPPVFPDPFSAALLKQSLSKTEKLTKIELRPPWPLRGFDGTHLLVAFLAATSITHLDIADLEYDPFPVVEALKKNTTLERLTCIRFDCLALLEALQGNTTLEVVDFGYDWLENGIWVEHGDLIDNTPYDKPKSFYEVQSYLRLNKLGRKEMRSVDTSKNMLMHILSGGKHPTVFNGLKDSEQLDVVYGLLRERPDAWCYKLSESQTKV